MRIQALELSIYFRNIKSQKSIHFEFMKKIYLLFAAILLLQLSNNLSAQVILSEDFSTASDSVPPTGWTITDLEGGGEVWVFNNPGGRDLNLPINDPAAIFDSDFNGSSSGPENSSLESPAFDASVVTTNLMLSFDHRFYNNSDFFPTSAIYYVEVWDGTTWVEALSGTTDSQDPDHVILNITAAADGNAAAKVRFRWTGNWGYWWIVDNVVIEEVSCPQISNLEVTSFTATTMDISWTAGGTETNWNIEYGPAGFPQGTGTPGTASGTPEFSVGSLTADTHYDFYVQADCGGGDESVWFGPFTGFTGYCEFEGVDSYYFIDNFSTSGGLNSNIFNLGSGYGANGYEDATSMTVASFADGPDINISIETGNGAYLGSSIWVDWNQDLVFDASERVFVSNSYEESVTGSFNVPAGTPVGTYRMRVLVDNNDNSPDDPCSAVFGNGEAEDYTFEVLPTPTCLPVGDLTIESVTASSVDISWTPGDSETNWNIEYGLQGFTPGSGTPGTATGTPEFTVGSLTADTHYDFYIQADCGGGDESYWMGPITAYTGYCEFIASEPNYYINNFKTTGGATSNISNMNSGMGTNGYENATAMTVAQFEGGPNVNFTADFGFEDWYTFGMGIWVDWNNNMSFEPSEQMFQSSSYQSSFSGSFNVPAGVAVGSYRMRVMADYNNYAPTDACSLNYGQGEAEDYTFVVVPIPTCMPVSDLEIESQSSTSLGISWTPGSTETEWNIEWGVPGFVPGTGTGIDSAQQTSSASFNVGGLTSTTEYDIYVQAVCSSTDSSYWTLVSGVTTCPPTALPWTEDFESLTSLGYGIFPDCWTSENEDWISDDENNTPGIPNSGSNFVGIYYSSDDHLWTPQFDLVAGEKYEFSFMWTAADDYNGWAGTVVVNDMQSPAGADTLGTFITSSDEPSTDYQKATFCFTPTTSGVYNFGVHVSASSNPWFLSFDDFSLIQRMNSAGTGGAIDACQIEGLVDLSSVAVINDTMGAWTFAADSMAIVNESFFDPELASAGIVSVDYITYGCLVDTVSVLVHVYPASNAGVDGNITACKHEQVNLFNGLTGNPDTGGDWYDPSNNLLAGSQFTMGAFPGSFNFRYIVGNDVCPDDTSGVVVTVLSTCDLSVDESAFESVNLYPNPSTGLVYIESALSAEPFNLEVTDVNGRLIETGSNAITNGVNTINLSNVQRGTYFFKLSNENAEKVYRVVIQ